MRNARLSRVLNLLSGWEKGLTAIELAVVMAILAILAGMVAGSVTGMNQSARSAAATTDTKEIQKAVDRWVGEQNAARYPVSTPVVVDASNAVASSATPAANGLPQAGAGLYVRVAFADSFTNPEGTSKSFVPDYLARIPKFGRDDPNPWVVDENGTAKLLAAAVTSTPTASPTSTSTSSPTATRTSTPTASPTATSTPAPDPVWATRAAMPTARDSLGLAAASNGKLYAIGGVANSVVLATVQEYAPATNVWTTKSSMPTARYGLGVVEAGNGKLYAVGGYNSVSGYLATVEEYDPATNSWTTRTSMPSVRTLLGVVAASNGKIYAIGGYGDNGYGYGSLAKVEEYDPATNAWATKSSMSAGRNSLGVVAASNGKIYAIGGQVGNTALSTVEEYDPLIDSWNTKSSMPTAHRYLGAAAANNGMVYAIGGWPGGATVEGYNPATNAWVTKTSLPTARGGLGVATASNGKIYAIGGENGSPLSTNEEATIQ